MENKEEFKRHAVVYTDGSFRPNNEGTHIGFWGSGCHGYIYTDEPDIKTIADKPSKFVITNEGYILNEEYNKFKDKVTEVKPIYYFDACYSFLNKGTVNTGEMSAVIEVLKDMLEHNLKINDVLILTDSNYVIYEITRILEGNTHTDENNAVKADFQQELVDIISKYLSLDIDINVSKVKGHSGNPGNDIADYLAVHARLQSSDRNIFRSFNLYSCNNGDKVKYWNFSMERHPFLEYRQLFFTNSLRGKNDDVFYSILDYKTDKEPGVKTHDACFGLVRLKNRQDIIEDTIQAYHRACNNMSVISTLDLNLLYSRLNSYYFRLFGPTMYNFLYKTFSLNTFNKTPIVYSIRPPGLANQALERTQYLHHIIHEYKNREEKKSNMRQFIDITDMIYDITEDKKGNKKYSCKIESSAEHIKFTKNVPGIGDTQFFIILNKDTLSRNQFKHLEKNSPKVFLVTEHKTKDMLDYFTLIETDEGDIGVFCNFYSGKIILDKKKK